MSCKRLLLGHGYLGKRVAEIWRAQGDTVTAVTRSGAKAEVLQAEGYRAIVADVTQPATLVDLPSCDTLLYAVGYDRTGDASIHEVYAEGFANVLAALPAGVRRVIYISTTGVYGGANGKWVDEATPTDPQRPGGRASLAAEEALRASRFASRGAALRLAGLYGPDRLPYLAKLREGTPLEASPEGWLNLIHVDDAAAAVVAAADVAECVAELAPIISVCDGAPSRRGDYYAEAARLLGGPTPRFVEPAASSPRAARAAVDRRVRNDQMVRSLGIRLAYPSYREGLAAVILGETSGR